MTIGAKIHMQTLRQWSKPLNTLRPIEKRRRSSDYQVQSRVPACVDFIDPQDRRIRRGCRAHVPRMWGRRPRMETLRSIAGGSSNRKGTCGHCNYASAAASRMPAARMIVRRAAPRAAGE